MNRLMEHPWPGNIRELENAVEHAFVICNSNRITLNDLPVEIREKRSSLPLDRSPGQTEPQVKLTKETLLTLLQESNWNKAEVGRRIQKSRTSVWKYMKKWNIPLN